MNNKYNSDKSLIYFDGRVLLSAQEKIDNTLTTINKRLFNLNSAKKKKKKKKKKNVNADHLQEASSPYYGLTDKKKKKKLNEHAGLFALT